MADYSPPKGKFSNKDRAGFKFQWDNTDDDGVDQAAGTERWKDSPLLSRYEAPRRDHVCRPVIIGSDGRATPVVFTQPLCPTHHHADDGSSAAGYKAADAGAYKAQEFVSSSDGNGTGFGVPGSMFRRQIKASESYSAGDAYDESSISNGGRRSSSLKANNIETAAGLFRKPTRPATPAAVAGSEAWSSPSSWYTLFQPSKKSDATTAVMDSSEAAKKYGGRFVW